MDRKTEIYNCGKRLYLSEIPYTGINTRKYAAAQSFQNAKYILAEERFITNHDDTARFVEVIDSDDHVIKSWKFDHPMTKHFSDPAYYDDDCLVLYLRETYRLPVIGDCPPE